MGEESTDLYSLAIGVVDAVSSVYRLDAFSYLLLETSMPIIYHIKSMACEAYSSRCSSPQFS